MGKQRIGDESHHLLRRRDLIVLLGFAPFAQARGQDRMRRVGVLVGNARDAADRNAELQLQPFLAGLKDAGWIEGRNIELADRFGAGDPALNREGATQLVALRPDVIYAITTAAVDAVFHATRTIPVVFSEVTDPVGPGYVVSLAHPEGNITGFISHEPSLGGKWVQLLREVAPATRYVGMLYNPMTMPFAPPFIAAAERGAGRAVAIVNCPVESDQDIDAALGALARKGRCGVIVLAEPFTSAHSDYIIADCARFKLPALWGGGEGFVRNGGLMSYAYDQAEGFRSPASYVSRILKGEKPADLPVQTPTRYDLIINLKTAKALGLTVPVTLLATADVVIE